MFFCLFKDNHIFTLIMQLTRKQQAACFQRNLSFSGTVAFYVTIIKCLGYKLDLELLFLKICFFLLQTYTYKLTYPNNSFIFLDYKLFYYPN